MSGLSIASWDPQHLLLRAAVAAGLCLLLVLMIGPASIAWLRRNLREPADGRSSRLAELHAAKGPVPTMAGLLLVAAMVTVGAVMLEASDSRAWVCLLALVGFAGVGAIDDLLKVRGRGGLAVHHKLAAQTAAGVGVAIAAYAMGALPLAAGGPDPFVAVVGEYGAWLALPLVVMWLVGFANAVNLTDGLDGLAAGCLLFAIAGLGILALAASHPATCGWVGWAQPQPVAGVVIVLASALGAVLGFIWFNCHPAQVFMGDTGSQALGALLAIAAIALARPALLLLLGGVFVIEALSVAAQVISFRWRRKRVLLCAPLHHHYQFRGLPESRIVVRFWIAAAVCMVGGLGLAGWQRPAQEAFVATSNAPSAGWLAGERVVPALQSLWASRAAQSKVAIDAPGQDLHSLAESPCRPAPRAELRLASRPTLPHHATTRAPQRTRRPNPASY